MINFAETLQKRIGPLPVWMYGVGIGGGILVAQFLRGNSRSNDAPTDAAQTENVDLSTATSDEGSSDTGGGGGGLGSVGLPDSQPNTGNSNNNQPAPVVPAPRPAGNQQTQIPNLPIGSVVKIPQPAPQPSRPTVTIDRGAKGLSSGSNTAPTLGMQDIGGVVIAPPDNQARRARTMNIRPVPIGMTPQIAGQKPRSTSRTIGRGHHGAI